MHAKQSSSARLLSCLCVASVAALLCLPSIAQTQDPGSVVTSKPCQPGASLTPGPACLLAHQDIGALPDEPVYWHIDTFPDESGTRAAKSPTSTVVVDFGKVWLFTVAGKHWHASGGMHVATIGPFPVIKAKSFSADYVHSYFAPGMSAPLHKHSGPEGFYAVDGDTCLEMPDGAQTGFGPGNAQVMPGGEPMLLMAIGKTPRRAFALILHDATQPATTRISDWQPAGRCARELAATR